MSKPALYAKIKRGRSAVVEGIKKVRGRQGGEEGGEGEFEEVFGGDCCCLW